MDFIEGFMEYTEGIPSPDIFRLWSAISTVAGALERRVYLETARRLLYPNLFTLLVAPPGVGKSNAIGYVSDLWYSTKKFHVAPDDMTKAALIDALVAASTKKLHHGNLMEYHSLLAASSEFGVLVPAHDTAFLNVLNHIYDNPRNHRENRRSLEEQIDITNPQLNILAGTQPGYLAALLPEEAWSMGFTSRLIMIYSATPVRIDLFSKQEDRTSLRNALINKLKTYAELVGEMPIEDAAKDTLQAWADADCAPVPSHSKLQHYIPRRIIHVLKLSMISAISRTDDLAIKKEDVDRAFGWLFHAEKLMPDVFRDMTLKSDAQIMEELHHFLWQQFSRGQNPIHESKAIFFLQQRVPAEKVERVLGIAVKSGMLQRHDGAAGPMYVPVASHMHGIE